VLDYNSKTVVNDIVAALKGITLNGAMDVDDGGAEAYCWVMARVKFDKKFVFMVSHRMPKSEPKQFTTLNRIACSISWDVRWWVESNRYARHWKQIYVFGVSWSTTISVLRCSSDTYLMLLLSGRS
jgi:hypothetical protein